MSAHLHESQKRVIRAVQNEFFRIDQDIRMDQLGPNVSAEERNLIVAQNTLRTCIEAVLERLLPYSEATPLDLGVRLASYCLSALPVESQEGAVEALAQVLRAAHPQRLASGIRLSTTWDMPGQGERDNFPAANS